MGVFLAPKVSDATLHSSDNSRFESSLELSGDIPNETDWTKVKDITSRRRIQNRISQRNRRRKLKEKQEQQQRADNSPSPRPDSRQSTPPMTRMPPSAQASPHDEDTPNLMFEKTPYLRHLMSRNGSVSSTCTPVTPSQTSQDLSSAQFLPESWTLPPKEANSVVSQILHAQRHGSTSSGISDHYTQRQGSTSSELSDHYAFRTPPTRHDLDDCNQVFWDASLMQTPGFEDNGLNLYFNDCELFTSSAAESSYRTSDNIPLDPRLVENYITPPLSSKSSPDSLQSTMDSTHTDIAGYTPLHLAVQKGHLSIVQILLEADSADLNAIAKDGMSPLHLSIYSGNHSMTNLLLEKGANCDIYNAIGQNILHLAAEKGDLTLVKLVLNHTKDPRKRDCLGQTAFHCAVAQGHEDIVRFMLAKGVN